MGNAKMFIAYLLVVVFLLGTIAASAQAIKDPERRMLNKYKDTSVIAEVDISANV